MKASGFLDVGCELKNPNFAAMAEAMGIKGVRVEAPGDLEGALKEALAHDGPALVDVVSARQELAMPPKATIGQALNFNLFLLKAVMDGRAAQVIDLARVNFGSEGQIRKTPLPSACVRHLAPEQKHLVPRHRLRDRRGVTPPRDKVIFRPCRGQQCQLGPAAQ